MAARPWGCSSRRPERTCGWRRGSSRRRPSCGPRWEAEVRPILEAASLKIPEAEPVYGGRIGRHTEHLTALLTDFQMVARSGMGETW
jgi:1,2-phenylacetyl-CoA epoxidase catalytic subunit